MTNQTLKDCKSALPNSLFRRMLMFNPIWNDIVNEINDYNCDFNNSIKEKEIVNIYNSEQNYISVLIVKDNHDEYLIDRSDLLRYLIKKISLENKNAIIVIGISQQLLNELLVLMFDYVSDKNLSLKKSTAIFFYIKNSNKNNLFVLAGENINECALINSIIDKSPFYQNIFTTQHNVFNELIKQYSDETTLVFPDHLQSSEDINGIDTFKNPLFIGQNLIIRSDLIFGNNHDNEKLSYSEFEAKKDLERSIDNDSSPGYNWINTHLKIGTKLHLKDFVYGKKMFQKNYESSRFAYLLAQEFFLTVKDSPEKNNFTFVGYGFYSELLVSQLKEFVTFLFKSSNLDNLKSSEINYTIVKDEEEIKFIKLFKDIKDRRSNYKSDYPTENIVIIVPISSTLTTCLKIENAFWKELDKEKKILEQNTSILSNFKIFSPFFTMVVVGDGEEKDIIKNINDNKIISDYWVNFELNNDLKRKYMITINREKKQELLNDINLSNNEIEKLSERKNRYFIYIKSEWQHIEDCLYCFPDQPLKEKPLFSTDKVAVTPSLIFKSPKNIFFEDDNLFFDVSNDYKVYDSPYINEKMINEVHYRSWNKDVSYYLHYDKIFNANKNQIEKWAKEINHNTNYSDKILLISPDKSENGDFVHLINRIVFQERANIIKVDNSGDHFRNFDQFFKSDISFNTKIFYVDNLLATCDTLLYINDNINMVNDNINLNNNIFKGIFCLINRLDFEATKKIQKIINPETSLFSFISLNVPVISKPLVYCPMCDEEKSYEDLAINSSLDVIREYFKLKELPRYKKVIRDDLYKLQYGKNHHNSDIIKFALTHYLNQALADQIQNTDFLKVLLEKDIKKFDYYNLENFTKGFIDYIENKKNTNLIERSDNLKIKSNIIKILAHYPFKRHRGINIAVFYWVLNDLYCIVKVINDQNVNFKDFDLSNFEIWKKIDNVDLTETDLNSLIDNFNYFRCLIKYGCVLQIAFLLSVDFLSSIIKIMNSKFFQKWFSTVVNPNIDKKSNIYLMYYSKVNFNVFCTAHIQKSLLGVETRSLTLEKNIVFVVNKHIKNEINKSFLELLQLENTKIIKEFINEICIENHDNSSKSDNILNEDIYKHNSSIKNLELFCKINKSENNYFKLLSRKIIKLYSILKKPESVQSESKNFEESAKNITDAIANILEFDLKNKGGGFFLYDYQTNTPKTIVMGKVGKEDLAKIFESSVLNESIIHGFLNGLNYFDDNLYNELKEPSFTWTNFSIIKDNNSWKGQNGNDYSDCIEVKILDNLETNINRIFLYRISDYTCATSSNSLKGKAVFVFYDEVNMEEYDLNQIFCIEKVRYIHVFRNKILEYFMKNYENDSFRAWINEKYRIDYGIMLNHGIEVYRDTIKKYYNECLAKYLGGKTTPDCFKYLDRSIQYLTNKLQLISLMDNKSPEFDCFNLEELKQQLDEDYKFVLNLIHTDYVNRIDYNLIDYQNEIDPSFCIHEFVYPNSLRKELIFEIFRNISKHERNYFYNEITERNKLEIKITIENIKDCFYLKISNNHCYLKESEEQIINYKITRITKNGLSMIYKIIGNFDSKNNRNISIKLENVKNSEMKIFSLTIPLFTKGDINV